jgi:hypothetical protein
VNSDFEWLADWFVRHCDGEWEHGHGITVETIDNPGWGVKIWLTGTELDGRPFTEIDDRLRSDDDWLLCRVNGEFFEGVGGLQTSSRSSEHSGLGPPASGPPREGPPSRGPLQSTGV